MRSLTRILRRAYSNNAKEIFFGDEGRASMARGVNVLAKAVSATLGPKGRTVIIEQSYGSPKITKDGVTVAKSIELADRMENLGASLLQSVASKTNEVAGDGTTTATILARAFVTEGLKCVASGVSPAELRRGVNLAVEAVIKFLSENSTKITSPEQITQVATISANGDHFIGQLISQAMERVGKEGVITISDGKSVDDDLEVTEGMKVDRGFISPYFVTDAKEQRIDFDQPLVLLSEKKISAMADVIPAMEAAARSRRPLLIIAEDVDGEALAALVLNKLRGQVSVCAVRAPGFGDNRKAMLEDIAAVTGATLFGGEAAELSNVVLEKLQADQHLGSAKSVSITKDETIILNGAGSKEVVHERCESLRREIQHQEISEYDKEKKQERLARMTGGVAVIRVGGVSEVDVGERKDRFVDALNATRAAVEEGVIPGGGSALIKAVPLLTRLATDAASSLSHDARLGVRIVAAAIKAPLRTIVDNAGESGSVVVGEVLKKSDDFTFGYDAAKGVYVDMPSAGIIDPLKVVRTALSDAAGVASMLTTTEAMIVSAAKPADNSGAAAAAAGGMPSMAGMGM